jgi:hypothetical protein
MLGIGGHDGAKHSSWTCGYGKKRTTHEEVKRAHASDGEKQRWIRVSHCGCGAPVRARSAFAEAKREWARVVIGLWLLVCTVFCSERSGC